MSLLVSIVLFLVCCIGNAELWVIVINRRHALRFRHSTLRKVRTIHDVGITVIPLVLLFFIFLPKDGLFHGATFSDLTWDQKGLVIITAAGFVPFLISVIKFQMRRQPERTATVRSELKQPMTDAHSTADAQSMIGTASTFVQSLPGNQIWHLEINSKTLQFPAQSTCRDSNPRCVKVAHFSDVHLVGCPGEAWQEFLFDQLAELKPDAFMFTGDLLDKMEWLPFVEAQFKRLAKIAPGYFILGNHDWHLDWERIRDTLSRTGWKHLGETFVVDELNGSKLLLAGTEAPWLGSNPVVPPRDEECLRILLSHAPDQRDYAIDNQFDLLLAGHNHGGQITFPMIGPIYSPSIYGTKYSGGCFEHKDMLIHVSRGTGSRDPVRLFCPPEISLLTLELEDVAGQKAV